MFLWNSALEFITPLHFQSSWYPRTGVHFKPVEMQKECSLFDLNFSQLIIKSQYVHLQTGMQSENYSIVYNAHYSVN